MAPSWSVSIRRNPARGIPSQLTCTPSCLVPAVVASHRAGNWAGGGEAPLPPCSSALGGCENWRDLSCQLCSQCWGPGSCLCWALPAAASATPVLHLLGLPSSRARVSPCRRGQTPVVVSLCLLAPLLSYGARALLGSRPVPFPRGVGPTPSSPAAWLSSIYC